MDTKVTGPTSTAPTTWWTERRSWSYSTTELVHLVCDNLFLIYLLSQPEEINHFNNVHSILYLILYPLIHVLRILIYDFYSSLSHLIFSLLYTRFHIWLYGNPVLIWILSSLLYSLLPLLLKSFYLFSFFLKSVTQCFRKSPPPPLTLCFLPVRFYCFLFMYL
jgi:hypothetical protein